MKKLTKAKRKEMIDRMVQDDIDSIMQSAQNDDFVFLDAVLRGNGHGEFVGWMPYNHLTDKQVVDEYLNREFENE